MTFKKINEDTVCCILTESDMKEYGVQIDDFLINREKVQGVLQMIVQRAVEELGLELQRGLVSLQIMPLPDNGISIMFSEKGQMNIMDFINQVRKLLGNLNQEQKPEGQEQKRPQATGAATPARTAGGDEKGTRKKGKSKKDTHDKGLRIYEFSSIDDAAEFCTYIPTKCKIVSQLYKNPKTGAYLLTFTRSKLSGKEFAAVCSKAAEFGRFVSDDLLRAAYVAEHMEPIIEEKAVKSLRRYARKPVEA